MSAFALSDLERRVANMIRIGKVSALDAAAGRVRVAVAGTNTTWLPWLVQRAGGDRSWWAPEVGEQVVVLSPGGDLTQAVVAPSIYQAAHAAPGDVATVQRTTYADGTVVEYDRAAHKLKVDCVGSVDVKTATSVLIDAQTTVTIKAATSVLVDAPLSTFTGAVIVQGLLTYQAGMAGSGGGGAAASITGNVNVTGGNVAVAGGGMTASGDVVAGTVHLKTHVHPENGTGGGITSAPTP